MIKNNRWVQVNQQLALLKQKRTEGFRLRKSQFLSTVLRHQAAFYRFHTAKRTDCSRMARACRQVILDKIKQESKDHERAEHVRIMSIRDSSAEEYLRLLEDTKQKRMRQLLLKIDSFIESVHEKIGYNKEKAQLETEELRSAISFLLMRYIERINWRSRDMNDLNLAQHHNSQDKTVILALMQTLKH